MGDNAVALEELRTLDSGTPTAAHEGWVFWRSLFRGKFTLHFQDV